MALGIERSGCTTLMIEDLADSPDPRADDLYQGVDTLFATVIDWRWQESRMTVDFDIVIAWWSDGFFDGFVPATVSCQLRGSVPLR
jgi:hypothetical protein